MQNHLVFCGRSDTMKESCFVYAACPRAVFVRVAGMDGGGAFVHDVTFGQ